MASGLANVKFSWINKIILNSEKFFNIIKFF